ncbi:MAG TPA: GNAT family N-acetyltransferase [Solirubrobacteraceae bacterium]|nr:GNAT family N-acetyltransferase [Solirubrobacteraceae bacterium]
MDPTRGVELTDEEEEQLEPLLRELLGPRAPDVLAFMDAFEDAHPRSEPHWYLSLLGTASRSRGQGIGMALLRDCLRRIDADGAPGLPGVEQPGQRPPVRGSRVPPRRRLRDAGRQPHADDDVAAAGPGLASPRVPGHPQRRPRVAAGQNRIAKAGTEIPRRWSCS